jgi:hypothetical protein
MTVSCGAVIVGLSRAIGGTAFGANLGITDFSIKQADDFGNLTVVERAYQKTGEFTVFVRSAFVDTLQDMLAGLRARPALYIGDDAYGSAAIYGFFKEFVTAIQYADVSVLTIQIEGLT